MSDFLIYEDDQGLQINKQKYIGDVTFTDVMEGRRYTTKIKHYGNGYFKIYVSNTEMFGASMPKKAKPKKAENVDELADEIEGAALNAENTVSDSPLRDRHKDIVRRSAEAIHDIILLNEDLTYFFSVTINPADFDSTDPIVVSKKMLNWLNNQVKRRDLKYVLVGEYHPNSVDDKIHFHGLINEVFKFVDSGTRLVKGFKDPIKLDTIARFKVPESRIRSVVYNVPEWKHGFTTAIPVYGSRVAIARYITKYITKADNAHNDKIFGKYYWSSRSCIRKPTVELIDDGGIYFRDLDHLPAYKCCGSIAIKYENLGGDLNQKDLDDFLDLNPQFSDRLGAINAIKRSFLNASEKKIEAHRELQRGFEEFLREREKRQKTEREELQRLRDLQAAERRARREWRDRQLKFTITKGGAIDSIRASEKL